ncbi:MAG: universal stress protein [Solirubrobacterales bacterium]
MGKIVCGYDGSNCSRAALVEAASQAKACGDELIVVFGYVVSRLGGVFGELLLRLLPSATIRNAPRRRSRVLRPLTRC